MQVVEKAAAEEVAHAIGQMTQDNMNGGPDTYLGDLFLALQSLGQSHKDGLCFTTRHISRQPKSIDLVPQVDIRY